jgi:chlorobactene glucosyltransferase
MTEKKFWGRSWPRLVLWANALGIAAFYLILWKRTVLAPQDHVRILPVREVSEPIEAPKPAKKKRGKTTLVSAQVEETVPLVSIIVPARDEERSIRRCVQSLLAQDYERYEIIVVNDGSTDATGKILEELARTSPHGSRLRMVSLNDELPAGWAGKPHAIHHGVQEARGEWLLFTDADTWHAPNALRSSVTYAIEEKLALFTMLSAQELPTFWERVLMPVAFMGISMLYPPRLVNDPASSVAVANGQYLLLRRDVYEQLGGYARPEMRGTLLDDRDMAHLVKEHGYPIRFIEGDGLVWVRMYQSFDEIWRGWRKNSFLGNRGGLPSALLQLVGLPMVTVMPFLLPLYARLIRDRGVSKGEGRVAAAVALLPLLAYRRWLDRTMRVPRKYVLSHPLGGLIFTGILGEGVWRIVTRKGVDWRGRQYHNNDGK